MIRTDKENYYLDIAETVAERGTCLRRNFGASWVFPVESAMRSAVLFMQRQTQSSALPAGI